jgi:hypothetical protein
MRPYSSIDFRINDGFLSQSRTGGAKNYFFDNRELEAIKDTQLFALAILEISSGKLYNLTGYFRRLQNRRQHRHQPDGQCKTAGMRDFAQ